MIIYARELVKSRLKNPKRSPILEVSIVEKNLSKAKKEERPKQQNPMAISISSCV